MTKFTTKKKKKRIFSNKKNKKAKKKRKETLYSYLSEPCLFHTLNSQGLWHKHTLLPSQDGSHIGRTTPRRREHPQGPPEQCEGGPKRRALSHVGE